MLQPSIKQQPRPAPPVILEEVSFMEALEEFMVLAAEKAEFYIVAAKMAEAMGPDAPADVRKDTKRRVRLLSIIEAARKFKASGDYRGREW